ncbi:MAG: penicillin-binding protein 2 [Actinomycetota bacterium]|nr:penicillin-binding protein 2 [Actinomycetota bacterium]
MSTSAALQRRSRALRVLITAVFGVIALRLVYVQVVGHHHYAALSRAELTQTISVPPLRGGIYDRNGEVLAESIERQTVVADPYLIKDPSAVAKALAPVLGLPQAQLRAEVTEHAGFVYLDHRVSSSVAKKVSALALPGINLVDEPQEVSPAGQLALPVIGTVGADGQGLSGLQYEYQSLLAGKPGSTNLLEAPGGVVLSGGGSHGSVPVQGTGLELTIDESLQYVAEQALGAEIVASHAAGGTAVVMDVKTGDILAMANLQATPGSRTSAPPASGSTTPSTTVPPLPQVTTTGTLSGPGTSGYAYVAPVDTLPAGVEEAPSNTAVTQVYEPGSVFKIVTFSAALQDGVITPEEPFVVPPQLLLGGYIIHDAEPHGTITMTASQIIAQSSNIGTSEIAQRLGESRLLGQVGNLGFGKPTGLHFPGSSPGLVVGPAQWTGSTIGSLPIGQVDAVSAQQLADAFNAIANGGVMVPPRLVRGTVSPSGSVTRVPVAPAHRVIAPTADAELVKMLEGVVKGGTGVEAKIDGYTVAGKTGTANIPYAHRLGYIPGAFYGTFAGFAPAQRPVLTCVVVLKEPTPPYGGAVAAPVFATIMGYALHHYGIPTDTMPTSGTSNGAFGPRGTISVPAQVKTGGA